MKKVLSVILAVILVVSMMTIVPAMASEEESSTLFLSGIADSSEETVNVILTDKNAQTINAASIKYINQVKPDSLGRWQMKLSIDGNFSDYNIRFRQGGKVETTISPEFIGSMSNTLNVALAAQIADRLVTATLNIENPFGTEKALNVYIAMYDDMGNLAGIYAPKVSVTEDIVKETLSFEQALSDNIAYARVMCWSNMEPLDKRVHLEIKGDYIHDRGSIGNVFKKLNDGKSVKIAYLGGSVTAGQGVDVSQRDTLSWRAKSFEWFEDNYPNNEITQINASIGGMGSLFGAARLYDMILKNDPDIVFVMCSINDRGSRETKEQAQRQMEDIIRQIREYDSAIDIVIGYDTDTTVGPMSELYPQVVWHEEVARLYGVTTMNMGRYLADRVMAGDYTFADVLSDTVHPNATGYDLYYEIAEQCLETAKENANEEIKTYTMPSVRLFGSAMNNRLYIAGDNLDANGASSVTSGTGIAFFPKMFYINQGSSMTFTVEGENLGLYTSFNTYTGSVNCIVDGVDMGDYEISSYAPTSRLAENMGEGTHDITITNNTNRGLQVNALFTWDDK